MWKRFAQLHARVWVERVPTEDNIADLPSREEYELLKSLGAKRVPGFLEPIFQDSQSWEALSIRNVV